MTTRHKTTALTSGPQPKVFPAKASTAYLPKIFHFFPKIKLVKGTSVAIVRAPQLVGPLEIKDSKSQNASFDLFHSDQKCLFSQSRKCDDFNPIDKFSAKWVAGDAQTSSPLGSNRKMRSHIFYPECSCLRPIMCQPGSSSEDNFIYIYIWERGHQTILVR